MCGGVAESWRKHAVAALRARLPGSPASANWKGSLDPRKSPTSKCGRFQETGT